MIAALRKFVRLERDRRWLVAEAVAVHAAMNVLVRVMPVGWISWRTAPGSGRARSAPTHVIWAVRTVAAYCPGSTCLTSALTAHVLLKRRGHDAVVRFGVAPRAHGRDTPTFHAWVECGGDAVIGADDLDSYRELESCSATAARIANSTAFAGR
jgi:Transglutaminase-like superfamily